MHFVYILQSEKDGGYYVGCTTDVQKRLAHHNAGKTKSLKDRQPLKILYTESYQSGEKAYERERQIKNYTGGEAFKKLINGGFA